MTDSIQTDDVLTPKALRAALGLERQQRLADSVCACGAIHTCAGSWVPTSDGKNWCFWKDDE